MLKIMNEEFFGFDGVIGDNNLVSINITVDPQNFELKSYRRSPFSSIIIDRGYEYLTGTCGDADDRKRLIRDISRMFSGNDTLQYNLYSDDEYEKITSSFDTERRFHTMLYTHGAKPDAETDRIIMIGAFPVKGIISPITKSNNYKLYNGCFINCKPFHWNGEYYNKLVYVLVEINSHFNFQEFVKTDHDEYGVLIDHRFYIDYDTIVHTPEISHIPYRGREELFSKPPKNIFYLSDVPKDIMSSRDRISVKL